MIYDAQCTQFTQQEKCILENNNMNDFLFDTTKKTKEKENKIESLNEWFWTKLNVRIWNEVSQLADVQLEFVKQIVLLLYHGIWPLKKAFIIIIASVQSASICIINICIVLFYKNNKFKWNEHWSRLLEKEIFGHFQLVSNIEFIFIELSGLLSKWR